VPYHSKNLSGCPVPESCPGSLALEPRLAFCLGSPSCPSVILLSKQYCPDESTGSPVLLALFWLSHSGFFVLAALFWCTVPDVLVWLFFLFFIWLSFSGSPLLSAMPRLSHPNSPLVAALSWQSCAGRPVLAALS
jgi:hypothetical protein